MNEIVTRRSVLNVLGGAFGSIFPMFRKPRSVEASVPFKTRVLPDYEPVHYTKFAELDERLVDEPVRDLTINEQAEHHDKLVLAHPISRFEQDKAILFDDDSFGIKDELRDKLSWDWKKNPDGSIDHDEWEFTNQGASEEEFAAFKRWINDDYTDYTFAEADTVERVSEKSTGECDAEPRRDLE